MYLYDRPPRPGFRAELEEFKMTNSFSPVWLEDRELNEEIYRKLDREARKFKKSLGLRLTAPSGGA